MLRIVYRNRHRNLPKASGSGSGPLGRITKLRKLVTALIRHERIEGRWQYLDEARGYVELLVQQAQRHGSQDPKTMDLADYWLMEKDLIPKLFEVIAPRYHNYPSSYTRMYTLPTEYPGPGMKLGLLELKGNPWPPVVPKERELSNTLINVLLREAQKDYRQRKYEQLNKTTGTNTLNVTSATGAGSEGDALEADLELADELSEKVKDLDLQETDIKDKPV